MSIDCDYDECQEEQGPCFEGWFIPAVAIEQLRKGNIAPDDLILMAIIDGFVVESDPPIGCERDDKYFADYMGVHVDQIRDMIDFLIDKKLIIQRIDAKGDQRLFTFYSYH